MSTIYQFEAELLDGQNQTFSDYAGKVLLIVNTASKCGFTPQFSGLEKLYEKYREQGFEVLGFPCNQFGGQDPGSNEQIETFCQKNYGVTFPMFAKVDVKGPDWIDDHNTPRIWGNFTFHICNIGIPIVFFITFIMDGSTTR